MWQAMANNNRAEMKVKREHTPCHATNNRFNDSDQQLSPWLVEDL